MASAPVSATATRRGSGSSTRDPTPLPPGPNVERLAESQLFELQRQAGNAAVAALLSPVMSRVPTPVAYRPVGDFDTMKLSEFDAYANQQADWDRDPALPAARRASLVSVLEFARAEPHPPLGPCGDLTVKELADSGLTPDVRTKLRAYSRGVQGTDTVGVTPTAVMADALRVGDAIGQLEAGIPKAVLHQNMGAKEDGKAQFPPLLASGFISDLVAYYTAGHPTLEADNGADIASYLAMRADGRNPVSFIGVVRDVRNFHRFLPALLDTIAANQTDVSKSKPLLLILHSGSDHNGAFHRDAELANTVQHPRNLSLMVEGADSLESLGTRAADIASHQGQGGRIEQVMLAGHGGPKEMELAGQPGVPGSVDRNTLDLAHNKARTERFLRGLVSHMAPGPDSSIVLNACLTAAEEVHQRLSPDPATAKRQILASLAHHPSLAGRIGQLAPGVRVEGNLSSVSAGSYMEIDAAGNPTGRLHQQIPSDPAAAVPDLANYIEHGAEPEGCARALVAVWAQDRPTAEARVNARLAQPISGWGDRVIHVVYDMFHAAPDNISRINQIADGVARGLSDFDLVAEQTVDSIWEANHLAAADEDQIFNALYPFTPATGQLAMNQVWLHKTPARRADFMTVLDTFPTTVAAAPHLTLDWIPTAALLPVADAPTASSAQMKLALWAVTQAGGDPPARAFLRANAAATHHLVLPGAATVESLTGGSSSENDVLTAIGLLGGGAPAAAAPVLNVDLDGDGINDFHVDSVTREGVVAASWLNIRGRPALAAPRVDVVPAGTLLYLFGASGQWWAVERPAGAGIGFVHQSWVRRQAVA